MNSIRLTINCHKFFLGLMLLFIFLRIPSFFEPHWYPDEGIYASIGYALSQGQEMYRDIYDHKPQLMNYFYAWMGNDQILLKARVTNLMLGIIALSGIYKLMLHFYSRNTAKIALIPAVLLLGMPIWEGNVANAENFFIPFTIWGFYFYFTEPDRYKRLFLSGLLFGIAFLIKFHPLLDFLALVTIIVSTKLAEMKKITLKSVVKNNTELMILAIGWLLPLIVIGLYEASLGNFSLFISSAFLDGFSYAGHTVTTGNIFVDLFQNSIFRLIGGLLVIIFLVSAYIKDKIPRMMFIALVISCWELIAVFLSGRAYDHYLLQLVFGITLSFAFIVNQIPLYPNRRFRLALLVGFFSLLVIIRLLFNTFDRIDYINPHRRFPNSYFPLEYYLHFGEYLKSGDLRSPEYDRFFNERPAKLKQLKELVGNNGIRLDEQLYVYTEMGWPYSYLEIIPPTRKFLNFQLFFAEDNQADLEEVISDLTTKKVEYIITDQGRVVFAQLEELIKNEYEEIDAEGDFRVYQRKGIGV